MRNCTHALLDSSALEPPHEDMEALREFGSLSWVPGYVGETTLDIPDPANLTTE